MNFLKNTLKWIFGVLLIALITGFFRFLIHVLFTLAKTLWLTAKYGLIVSGWLFYIATRVLTWPFRRCFPPKGIDDMSGIDFERFTAKWLALEGYRGIKTTPASSDYGVDILAVRDGTTIGVQCKRYSGKVGVAAIQEITAGLPFYDCQKGIVVTNSVFTQNAIDLAVSNGIELIDGEDLRHSRAAKSLVRGRFSIFMSTMLMGLISMLTFFLTVWVYRFQRGFLPLSLMFLVICLLCLANSMCELKDRERHEVEESYEYDEEEYLDDADPGDYDDLTAPF